jgi:hypothetical protein
MMKSLRRFLLISVGGLTVLLLLGMVGSVITGTRPDEVTSLNLISEWKWYRISLYLVVVGAWPWIARYAIRPQRSDVAVPEAERKEEAQKREADYRAMKAQGWKIALLFAFIEIVVIQQFGLGG